MKNEDKQKKSGSKKDTGFGLAVWIVVIIILVIFFIVQSPKVASNLKETDFFNKVFGKSNPEFVENAEVKPENAGQKNDVIPEKESVSSYPEKKSAETVKAESTVKAQNELAKKQQEEAAAEKEKTASEKEKTASAKTTETSGSSSSSESAKEEKSAASNSSVKDKVVVAPEKPAVMNLKLYFVAITGGGSFTRKEVTRSMKKSDSPLMDAINAIIEGPNVDEEKSGCRSLISEGTRLIGASVKNGVATLNFNDNFEFNALGNEGIVWQLQQIVFTATAFPTVESVQILISGEHRDFIGEGTYVAKPLNRNSF